MQKKLRIAAITIIMASLLVFPTMAQGNSEGSRPDRPSGNQQGPGGQDMPKPTESELSLLRIKGLIDNAQTQPELAIPTEQAAAILPILQEWEKSIESDSSEQTDSYIKEIANELTDSQNDFIPGPPGKNERKSQGKNQRPPKGGPEKVEFSTLLSELIEDLSL